MLIVAKRPHAESVPRELHKAIRACYTSLLTQEQLEEATGIPQATISRWARDASTPDPYEISAIERACDEEAQRLGDDGRRRPPGWILRHAGFIPDVKTVPEAIAMDPELDDRERKVLVDAYRAGVRVSRKRRARPDPHHD